ncbi:MAG: MarR family winged helix-turn-helix transcriptional regulator [Planctomycetota bacterium]
MAARSNAAAARRPGASEARLLHEIRQTKPFVSAGQASLVALLVTAARVERVLEQQLAAENITPAQYNVLRILRGAGAPLPTMEIAERMIEASPGITRLVSRLEHDGLVARETCREDGRRVLCRITREGLHLLSRLDPTINALDERLTAPLDERQHLTLLDLLDALRGATG